MSSSCASAFATAQSFTFSNSFFSITSLVISRLLRTHDVADASSFSNLYTCSEVLLAFSTGSWPCSSDASASSYNCSRPAATPLGEGSAAASLPKPVSSGAGEGSAQGCHQRRRRR